VHLCNSEVSARDNASCEYGVGRAFTQFDLTIAPLAARWKGKDYAGLHTPIVSRRDDMQKFHRAFNHVAASAAGSERRVCETAIGK
jgi:hypothetical protein